MTWKTLMICTGVLFAGSVGLVACGDDSTDDAPCETTADCAENEVCIGLQGARECEVPCTQDSDCREDLGEACIQVPDVNPAGAFVCDPSPEQSECTQDSDCGTGGTCIDGGCVVESECTEDTDCTGTQICEAGFCVEPGTETCASTADCIDDTAYCGGEAGSASCLDVSCGSPLNSSCTRCALGPNGGDRSSTGPVIFFPAQVGKCTQDPNQCVPGAAPWVCEFSFLAFGENLPSSGLNNQVRVLSSAGKELPVFGAKRSAAGNNQQYNFRACFPDTTTGGIGTAVLLRNDNNQPSNTLCVSGSLQ